MRLPGTTNLDGKAVVPGKIQVARMRHRRLAIGMGEDCRFTVVNLLFPPALCGQILMEPCNSAKVRVFGHIISTGF
jgi:hypothetical protein